MAEEVTKKAEEAGSGIIEGVGGLFDSAKKAVDDGLNAVKETAESAQKGVVSTVQSITPGENNVEGGEGGQFSFGGMWSSIKDAALSAQKAALEAAEKAKLAADDAAAKAAEAASNAGRSVSGEGQKEGEEAYGFFTGMWENAQKAAQNAQKAALEAAEHYKKAAEEAAANAAKAASDATGGAGEGIAEKQGTVISAEDAEKTPGWFSSMWENAQRAAQKAQVAAVEAAELAKKAAEQAGSTAAKAVEDAQNAAHDAAKSAQEATGLASKEGDASEAKTETKAATDGEASAEGKPGLLGSIFKSAAAGVGNAAKGVNPSAKNAVAGEKKEGDAAEGEEGQSGGAGGVAGAVWGALLNASETAVGAATRAGELARRGAEESAKLAKNSADRAISLASLEGIKSFVNAQYPGMFCIEEEIVDSTVKIATLNVWWRHGDWEKRQGSIVDSLRFIDADVICLQEVWKETASDGKDQSKMIAEELGYQYVYEAKKKADDAKGVSCMSGNCIMSRWPVLDSAMKALPSAEDDDRIVSRAVVEGPRGAIQVFCTNLNWKFNASDTRVAQIKEVCNVVNKAPKPKVGDKHGLPVLCGCFNAAPESDEIRMLTGRAAVPVKELVFIDSWEAAGEGPGYTWSNKNLWAVKDMLPNRRIDYVFSGWPQPGGRGHVTSSNLFAQESMFGSVTLGALPSAHYGVVAEIRY